MGKWEEGWGVNFVKEAIHPYHRTQENTRAWRELAEADYTWVHAQRPNAD